MIKDMVKGLYDSGRHTDGTHGNVQKWLEEVYASAGILGVCDAIKEWKRAFVGAKGVYIGVTDEEAILVASLSVTDEEVEAAAEAAEARAEA